MKTILYVDDNLPNRLLIKRIVEAEGARLLEAENASSGWETAVSQTPDLILMDIHLPGDINGLELTRKIKMNAQLSHIPVVAITAHGNAEMEDLALAVGCVGFLHKPADIRQIRAVLHNHLDMKTAVAMPITEKTAVPGYAYI